MFWGAVEQEGRGHSSPVSVVAPFAVMVLLRCQSLCSGKWPKELFFKKVSLTCNIAGFHFPHFTLLGNNAAGFSGGKK